ncbi:MAG: Gldg family protein [Planctomycetaceae bacterium]|nr:Gldg family protein [Planctomycetaceae bacterium]
MNRTLRAVLGIFFVAVIGVSLLSVTQQLLKHSRLDVTDRKLYTLSDGTREILGGLKQPITVKLFYTKTATMQAPDEIRYYNNYFTYVRALLDQYQKEAGGQLKLEVIDPRPYSEEEMAAIRYGLKRFSISEEENFFFGLVVQTEFGATKTIEFFSPDRQQFVEYDISYLIDTAVTRQKSRVGVLSSLPVMGDSDYMLQMMQMQGQQGRPKWGIITHLEKNYEVTNIPADTEEIKDIDFLLVIHPKDLPEKTQFAIDQFVLGGGRAIVCVDPYSINDMPSRQEMFSGGGDQRSSSNMPLLLKTWQLEMPDMTFAGDRELAAVGAASPNQRPEKILSILKLSSAKNCFNKNSVISAQINDVSTVFAGALKVLDAEPNAPKLEHTPLLMTTAAGNTWTVQNPYELMNPDYAGFMRRFHSGDKPVVMGCQVTGKFLSAFPNGIDITKEPAEGQDKKPSDPNAPATIHKTGLTESASTSSVVVLADVDCISDLVAYQRTFFGMAAVGDNSTLIFNALESLAGSDRLIAVRSRGNYKRPFTVVDQQEARAAEKTAEEESRIVAQISGFQQELNEKIRSLEGENKGELINQTILKEKKDIELKLLDAEKRLREIKMQKRESIEKLKSQMRFYCTIPGPVLTLVIAVTLGIRRGIKRSRSISHASDS